MSFESSDIDHLDSSILSIVDELREMNKWLEIIVRLKEKAIEQHNLAMDDLIRSQQKEVKL